MARNLAKADKYTDEGHMFASYGRHDLALERLEKALELYKSNLKDLKDPRVYQVLEIIGTCYYALNRPESYIENSKNIIRICSRPTTRQEKELVGWHYCNIAQISVELEVNKFEQAKTAFESGFAILKKTLGNELNSDIRYATAMIKCGLNHFFLKDVEKGQEIMTKARDILANVSDKQAATLQIAGWHKDLGHGLFANDRFEESIKAFKRGVKFSKTDNYKKWVPDKITFFYLRYLGMNFDKFDKILTALQYYKEALKIEAPEIFKHRSEVAESIGRLMVKLDGQLEQGLEWIVKANEMKKNRFTNLDTISFLLLLAKEMCDAGDKWRQCIEILLKAIKMCQVVDKKHKILLGSLYCMLGGCHVNLYESEKAVDPYLAGIKIYQSLGMTELQIDIACNLTNVYQYLENYPEGLKNTQLILSLLDKKSTPKRLEVTVQHTFFLVQCGKTESAIDILKDTIENDPDPSIKALHYANAAMVFTSKAKDILRVNIIKNQVNLLINTNPCCLQAAQALKLVIGSDDTPGEANAAQAMKHLGKSYAKLEDYNSAAQAFAFALTNLANSDDDPCAMGTILVHFADCLRAIGKPEVGLEQLEKAKVLLSNLNGNDWDDDEIICEAIEISRGACHAAMGNKDEAETILKDLANLVISNWTEMSCDIIQQLKAYKEFLILPSDEFMFLACAQKVIAEHEVAEDQFDIDKEQISEYINSRLIAKALFNSKLK
jgi:tetratricopeptide (TPR) repeat protein